MNTQAPTPPTWLCEIHLTINDLPENQLTDFKRICKEIGGKAVLIELPHGQHTQQPMLSVIRETHDIAQIHQQIAIWTQTLAKHGWTVIRQKIELPADQAQAFQQHYPDTQGYFEWHGKIKFEHLPPIYLMDFLTTIGARLSKNSLRNQQNTRFITIRHKGTYDEFVQRVAQCTAWLQPRTHTFQLIKSQYEWCFWDTHLDLDTGWTDMPTQKILPYYQQYYPDLSKEELLQLCAYEAFIRRSAKLKSRFMLKGSYLTRQFFDDPRQRIPSDLDFVALAHLPDLASAEEKLSQWVQKVTELDLNDGVYFTHFSENRFWRMIDYAMCDDFPTVNTDLTCWVDDEPVDLWLDVSFNLELPFQPEPLQYQTPYDTFEILYTVPLSMQIAWKIHQTIVRPRLKDIYDLTYLATKIETSQQIDDVLQTLVNECHRDGIDETTILAFFDYLHGTENQKMQKRITSAVKEGFAQHQRFDLPNHYQDFIDLFRKNMLNACLDNRLWTLPQPNQMVGSADLWTEIFADDD